MRRFIFNEKDTLIPWANEHIGNAIFDEKSATVGVEVDGKISAVVIYNHFNNDMCEISVASDGKKRWLSRIFLRIVFQTPFIQFNVKRLNVHISENNKASIKLATKLGFKQEGIMREAGINNENILVFGLLKRECFFLN